MAVTPSNSPDDSADPDRDEPREEEDGRSRMSFLEHLDELRRRIIYSVYAIVAGCVISFSFVGRIQEFLLRPLRDLIPNTPSGAPGTFIYTQPGEAFMLQIKLGFLVGLLIATPGVILQFWLFIAPGLYAREKKFAIPFVLSATALFLAGVWFAHVYAFPWTWKFFAGFTTDYMQFMPTIQNTFSFYVKMVLAFGLVFQMPVIVFVLARFGIVSARFLIKQAKYAILIIFIVAAVASPGTDVVSQLMMAAPMIILYALSVGVAWIFGKKKK